MFSFELADSRWVLVLSQEHSSAVVVALTVQAVSFSLLVLPRPDEAPLALEQTLRQQGCSLRDFHLGALGTRGVEEVLRSQPFSQPALIQRNRILHLFCPGDERTGGQEEGQEEKDGLFCFGKLLTDYRDPSEPSLRLAQQVRSVYGNGARGGEGRASRCMLGEPSEGPTAALESAVGAMFGEWPAGAAFGVVRDISLLAAALSVQFAHLFWIGTSISVSVKDAVRSLQPTWQSLVRAKSDGEITANVTVNLFGGPCNSCECSIDGLISTFIPYMYSLVFPICSLVVLLKGCSTKPP